MMIVLLAIALLGGGCASLRPPALETGDAVEAEVVETLHTKDLEGNEPPEAVQATLSALGQVIGFLVPTLGPVLARD